MQLCRYYLSDSKCPCGCDVGFLQFASCCLQSLSYLVFPGKWPVWQELLYLVPHELLFNVGDRTSEGFSLLHLDYDFGTISASSLH